MQSVSSREERNSASPGYFLLVAQFYLLLPAALQVVTIMSLIFFFYRMIQRQVARDVVDGGSVHVWLDFTSKMQKPVF